MNRETATELPTHPRLSDEALEAVARRFGALSSVSRLRVVNALMDGPLRLAELQERTGLSQSNLSRQVDRLEQAGCVRRDRRGREVEVSIADPTLGALCELVCGALERRTEERLRAFREE